MSQLWPPKVWLNLEPLLAVEVGPNRKLHLSASSWPLESNQAFKSGSVIASSVSWVSTLIMPSPPASALGLVVWASQPEGQRAGLPTNPYLMSTSPRLA